ncbi:MULTISPECIES: DUF4845 domain-containing protein [Pseudomonas]|uniref:DUF4845 domain-containing protein n=1 Tax=Pseudomonas eucalypticola TaxID=2599595 RepID=A0A7D5DC41_9PSED|nr:MULTISPECIES: DUF4845 domain-containing protein [Pseudomonas]QKZ06541.1 DUF4845 domain-containing protein [Pseudomonas eucalypticola]
MNKAASQKGVSLLGGLVILAVLGFVASTAFKVLPHYFDYWSMKKIIESVSTDKAQQIDSVQAFYTHVRNGMQVNNINDLDLDKALTVTLDDDVFAAHLQYEQREPLVGNLDLVVKFDHEFSVRKP